MARRPCRAEALLKRRRERLRMLPFVAASYVVDTVLLCAYFAAGVIPWQMPPTYLAAGLLLCAAFHVVLDSGLPERTRDHHLVMEQMVANAALAMAFLLWAPQVGVPLMMGCFVIFAFGALRMKFRSVVFGSTALALAMGLVVAAPRRGRRPADGDARRNASSAASGSRWCWRGSPSSASTAPTCAPSSTSSGPGSPSPWPRSSGSPAATT